MAIMIKIKTVNFDHEAGKTHVQYHEWDGIYFCASCALEVRKITLDGVDYLSPESIKEAVLTKLHGNNI